MDHQTNANAFSTVQKAEPQNIQPLQSLQNKRMQSSKVKHPT